MGASSLAQDSDVLTAPSFNPSNLKGHRFLTKMNSICRSSFDTDRGTARYRNKAIGLRGRVLKSEILEEEAKFEDERQFEPMKNYSIKELSEGFR